MSAPGIIFCSNKYHVTQILIDMVLKVLAVTKVTICCLYLPNARVAVRRIATSNWAAANSNTLLGHFNVYSPIRGCTVTNRADSRLEELLLNNSLVFSNIRNSMYFSSWTGTLSTIKFIHLQPNSHSTFVMDNASRPSWEWPFPFTNNNRCFKENNAFVKEVVHGLSADFGGDIVLDNYHFVVCIMEGTWKRQAFRRHKHTMNSDNLIVHMHL